MDEIIIMHKYDAKKSNSLAMPIHNLSKYIFSLKNIAIGSNIEKKQAFSCQESFIAGVSHIEMVVQSVLSLQEVTCALYNHFCMAELLQKK